MANIEFLRTPAADTSNTLGQQPFDNAFQPIVEMVSGRVYGYESLLRGYEQLGFETPLDLLDKAHHTNQLWQVEQASFENSVSRFATRANGLTQTLFLNFDTRLIAQGITFLERLTACLAGHGLLPNAVCIELTERFDYLNSAAFTPFIQTLKAKGFKLAIDDFGTGFNGLRVLSHASADYVKIDRHFLQDVDHNPRNRQLLKQAVSMVHALGARALAEGVETEAEYTLCRQLGCDLVQGWFIARPVQQVEELPTAYRHLEASTRRQADTTSADRVLIRKEAEPLPVVRETDAIEGVFDLFRRHPKLHLFPVVSAQDEPRGILHENELKDKIYHPFGRDLLKNKIYQRGVSHFVTPVPVADIATPPEQLLKIFADTATSHCLILTEHGRYSGVSSAGSLLRILHEKQLKSAQDQNPLTGLSGNRSIRQFVRDAAATSSQIRYLSYGDFDNFKPFNDKYGFQTGDMAIMLYARLLHHQFQDEDAFLGHVGGDDFFIGLNGLPHRVVQEHMEALMTGFSNSVRELYSDDDRNAGCIQCNDRFGNPQLFPLMRCSMAVLELPAGTEFDDDNDFSATIARLKKRAKESPFGLAWEQYASS